MTDKSKTHALVFLDCETIPSTDDFEFSFNAQKPAMEDVPEHKSLKDEKKIEEYKANKYASMISDWEESKKKEKQKASEEHHKEGLCSYRGRILCISFAIGDGEIKSISCDGTAEKERFMLLSFYNEIKDYKAVGFVGHNVNFDLLFIFHRCLSLGVKELANVVRRDHGYTKTRDFDTQEMASGGIEWKYRISLHNLCTLLGIETSKDEMDGSQVFDYYKKNKIEDIIRYCSKDVDRTRQCYYKLK